MCYVFICIRGGPLEIGGEGGGNFRKKNHAGPVHLEKKIM